MSNTSLDTSRIRDWRSIVTLIVFIVTNLVVLFPFHVPIYIPRAFSNAILDALSALRIISPRKDRSRHGSSKIHHQVKPSWVRIRIPLNFVTAPLIADLFLLAILAIGRQEVKDGTIGSDNISPIDILTFFITLAYIAISIDASGLIRYLAFKVLQWGGKVGHKLFFYLYAFFFGLGTFIGNDPIILSGTAFLAYMTRVSSNIKHPRAWIHTQFAVANTASAILVSSNPTNLVLAGAFNITFVKYTANIIVPVVVTAIVLFPFLLYIVFADEDLIPLSIDMHELPEEARRRPPVNPNIPHARVDADDQEETSQNEGQVKMLSLEEIMNPFVDKTGATVGAVIMATTLITILVLNAVNQGTGEHPVFWVTLPAAFVMFCWDVAFGWRGRHETRKIARDGRKAFEKARAERSRKEKEEAQRTAVQQESDETKETFELETQRAHNNGGGGSDSSLTNTDSGIRPADATVPETQNGPREEDMEKWMPDKEDLDQTQQRETLVSLTAKAYRWLQETFPTATAVATHLPVALVPFAFSMFVLVQALVTKGWVQVFAYGWDHWVDKTGTVGSVGGMGFISVIMCNFAGTNIGTTILLSRVIQNWQKIHQANGIPISDRTFWATVYSMALGVNFGAYSTAFSASLAGLLWRDILGRKHIKVRAMEFARNNVPIIAIAMTVGCSVLVGEVYIIRGDHPYDS